LYVCTYADYKQLKENINDKKISKHFKSPFRLSEINVNYKIRASKNLHLVNLLSGSSHQFVKDLILNILEDNKDSNYRL
jgi:hypothetical protein